MEVIEVGKSRQRYYSFPEHQHGYWEILLNTHGHGDMFIDGRHYPFRPGDIYVLPPYTAHKKVSAEGFRDISMFIKNFRAIGRSSLKHFCDDAAGSVGQIMEMAYRFTRNDNRYEQAAVNVMGDLIYEILVSYYNRSPQVDIRVEGIVELMYDHLADTGFDLEAAIDESGYSKSYFRKLFKNTFGEPPLAYFNHLRVDHARSLIQQFGGSRAIKDIAAASGFADPLYFSRIFRRYAGVSPKEYAKQVTAKAKDMAPIIMDTPKELLLTLDHDRRGKDT